MGARIEREHTNKSPTSLRNPQPRRGIAEEPKKGLTDMTLGAEGFETNKKQTPQHRQRGSQPKEQKLV